MAEVSPVSTDEVQIKCITLGKILDAFNGPLNEEQAWALCHQSAKFLGQSLCGDGDKRRDFNLEDGVDSVSMRKDGTVTIVEQEVTGDSTDEQLQTRRERELVDALGRVMYQSLDYGFHAEEERELSHPLESLIDSMTISEETDETDGNNDGDDEGIEDGNCSDDDNNNDGKMTTFEQVLQACRRHMSDPGVAPNHYQAVCRALVNECQELTTFLQKIATSKQTLRTLASDESTEATDGVDDLQPREWARIWMTVLHDLRLGVQLKKVKEKEVNKSAIEFELTPYEILMDDIRSRRYQLNKIMVNGDIPPRVKMEAHDIILDFIRSRPPLKPVRCNSWSDSKLMDRPDIEKDKLRKVSHHERLLADIRKPQQLQPVSQRVLAKKPKRPKLKSRRRRLGSGSAGDSGSMSSDIDSEDLDSFDESPELPKRKLKAEALLDWSDDDDMLETVTIPSSLPSSHFHHDPGDVFEPPSMKNNMYVYPERPKDPDPVPPKPKPTVIPRPPAKKLSAIHLPSIESDPGSPDFSTLPPGVTHIEAILPVEEFWLGGDEENEDEPISPLSEAKSFVRDDPRRHSIGVCQSQRRSMMKKSKSSTPTSEFSPTPAHLSLTVDEVIHIRTVLVKAELENLRVNPKIYQAVSAEKVCFSCKNKFLIFRKKNRCKLCQRLICNVCCKKMHLPRGHFLQIPVDVLSPTTPKRRRRKKRPASDYRGPETAEKFRSKKPSTNTTKKKVTISEPPTPSISPIHIPKFWRNENQAAEEAKDDVCIMCKDFLLNALKMANRTPTASPARTPSKSPNRTPTGSEQSTPTRKFSLDPAPFPPGLHPSSSQDTISRDNAANQGMEKQQLHEGTRQRRYGSANTNNNKALPLDLADSIPAMSITDQSPDRPWGINNDDEVLQEVRNQPSQKSRIPYII